MSNFASFVRDEKMLASALKDAEKQLETLKTLPLSSSCAAELLRNEQLLTAQTVYLRSILFHTVSGVGSRGSSIVLSENGEVIHDKLKWLMVRENPEFRSKVLVSETIDGRTELKWENCRPVPQDDDWFENVWHNYRNGTLYE
jgi:hypothetical protein